MVDLVSAPAGEGPHVRGGYVDGPRQCIGEPSPEVESRGMADHVVIRAQIRRDIRARAEDQPAVRVGPGPDHTHADG